jgi:hypothetical protein
MDIVSFVETLAGKWFSQRTTHYLASQTSKAGQSNLMIEVLPATDASLVQVCKAQGQDPAHIACGLKVDQDSRMDGDTRTTQRTTVMVMVRPTAEGKGILLQSTPQAPIAQGEYDLDNEVLTLTTQTPDGTVQERLWFANPNLRMRTSVFKVGDTEQMASFCSEIRLGGAPAQG